MRLSWDQYYLKMAEVAGLRSACLSRKVGAIIVKNNRVLSTGYNGVPAGLPHCTSCKRTSGEKLETCSAVHAEQNAILYALKEFGDISGSTIYVSTQPCTTCCKLIITAGIKRVIFMNRYADDLGLNLLILGGVELKHLEGVEL